MERKAKIFKGKRNWNTFPISCFWCEETITICEKSFGIWMKSKLQEKKMETIYILLLADEKISQHI